MAHHSVAVMPRKLQSQEQVIASLPAHLRPFVALQDYQSYTPRDHAVWRFLLHQLRQNLVHSAQSTYLEGLERTGISADAIPRIEDINASLNALDWRAVVVDGFLPPAIFMEFQALRVLVIAVNMRAFEHMLYTPAPDIVHESAGHAPFLIDIDYAEFLQQFGELGMQALSNQADMDVYEAVRNLSIVKETATATDHDIAAAQQQLDTATKANHPPSEAALLARLHWWTVEYGLVGDLDNYFIYGAGLLSSLGESVSCLDDTKVEKRRLTVDAINSSYDITAQQPQLYVTESCRHLSRILAVFGERMACQQGGAEAMHKALEAATVNTLQTNSGVQVAGKISQLKLDAVGNVVYYNTEGPTQLAFEGSELDGQSTKHHPHGFGSPLGRVVGMERCLSSYTVDELKKHQIAQGQAVTLKFLSGIFVTGKLDNILRRKQKNILFTFSDCTVIDADNNILFDPQWGVFDMAVGDSVVSVKGGSADQETFPMFAAPSRKTTTSQDYPAATLAQFELYQRVRNLRDTEINSKEILACAKSVMSLEKPDWLLVYEVLELFEQHSLDQKVAAQMRVMLNDIKTSAAAETQTLIDYALARQHSSD